VTSPAIRLPGFALHAGTRAAVVLARRPGPITFARGATEAPLDAWRIVATDGAVRIAHPAGTQIELVEHFLAALGGLGVREGVCATLEGAELPLLDGGARSFADALTELGLASAPPRLRIARSGRLHAADSCYDFETGGSVEISVTVEFAHRAIGVQRADWSGDRTDFRERIAPARTFGFASDEAALRACDRARLCFSTDAAAREAFARAVLIFDAAGPSPSVAGPRDGEIARHKLLDLVGDLAWYGGPPEGRVAAFRPGHAVTHEIVRAALAAGILSPR
jgi:UDP-3-O-[3-hydroxymyristoyl] N-acetylglucosamine deacetylase